MLTILQYSGTNLQEATHILMIDPLAGTKKEARDVEAQAIGRYCTR